MDICYLLLENYEIGTELKLLFDTYFVLSVIIFISVLCSSERIIDFFFLLSSCIRFLVCCIALPGFFLFKVRWICFTCVFIVLRGFSGLVFFFNKRLFSIVLI